MAAKEEFTIPNLWKRHGALLGIRAGKDNKQIADTLGVTVPFVWRVRKDLEDSGGDYEATASRAEHSRRSDALRIPEMVAQVEEIMTNDPGKSMRAISRDLGCSEFLIRTIG